MNRSIAAASSSSSRNRGVLLLGVVFGILSAMLMFAYLNSKGGDDVSSDLNSELGAETVVVMTRNVNVGEKITADMLSTKTVPASALVEGHIKDGDVQGLVGQVAVAPLYAGEQVLTSKVSTYEGQNTVTWKVPEGMRAVGLMVPHEAWIAGGLPQPGDRVDILGITTFITTDPLTGKEKPDLVAGYLAQDAEVLAVAQTLVKTVPKVQKSADGTTGVGAVSSNPGAQAVAPSQDVSTYEKAISITIALPPDLVAKVAMVDAMEDDKAQFRILPRQRGDSSPITGKITFNYEDIFPTR